ncbi:MAG TPA: hypothetical protein PKK26_10090 [Candidatus Wallbacteria bacterium]|nr:hypothetical protein [Candidatus Wallbacteria bacterium]
MINLSVKWHEESELIQMVIFMGKKKILDDLVSRVSLNEISEFLNEVLENKNIFKDSKTRENTITGDISDDDIQELYEYFDIEPR